MKMSDADEIAARLRSLTEEAMNLRRSVARMTECTDILTILDERDVLRAALEPFATAAIGYEPDEGDDAQVAWAHDFTIGSLRRARAALDGK